MESPRVKSDQTAIESPRLEPNQLGRRRDRAAGILFVVHLILFIAGAIFSIYKGILSVRLPSLDHHVRYYVTTVLRQIGIATGVSVLMTIMMHILTIQAPKATMHYISGLLVFLLSVWTIVQAVFGTLLSSIVYGLLTLMVLGIYIYNWSYIPFSAELLLSIRKVARRRQSLWGIVLIASVVLHIYTALAGFSIIGLRSMVFYFERAPLYHWLLVLPLALYTVFSIFWTVQVVMNLVRCIVAAVFVAHYRGEAQNASALSILSKMIHTGALSSVCYGSLFVAYVSLVRSFVGRVILILHLGSFAFIQWLQGILTYIGRYFNYFAFVRLSLLPPTTYTQAAISTSDSVRNSKASSLFGRSYLSEFIFFAGITVGFVSALIELNFQVMKGAMLRDCVASFIGSVFLGMVIPILYFMVIDSGASSIVVCIAEDPGRLSTAHPNLSAAIGDESPPNIT